ncbi:MAG TPA: hypothetical protein VF800_30590 [Telluria sp.]|jgi:hypothetical protein
MDGDDITRHNESMPQFPDELPIWRRVQCLLGYHKRETRQSAKGHCYGFQTEEGERRGIFGIHDERPMKLRHQCGRCHTLLG